MSPAVLAVLAGAAVDHGAELPVVAGADGLVALVVAGGPDGDARVSVRIADGRPVEVADGIDADCTFTLPAADAADIAAGVVEASVAFMRGRLKTAGDNGLVVRVLGLTAAEEFAPWLHALAEGSEVP